MGRYSQSCLEEGCEYFRTVTTNAGGSDEVQQRLAASCEAAKMITPDYIPCPQQFTGRGIADEVRWQNLISQALTRTLTTEQGGQNA